MGRAQTALEGGGREDLQESGRSLRSYGGLAGQMKELSRCFRAGERKTEHSDEELMSRRRLHTNWE